MKLALGLLVAVAACTAAPATRPADGTERGDCRTGSACDPGLACLSNLCVRPPPANCDAVADKLASFEVGNYAPHDQRAKVIADKAAACVAAGVSKDEGLCIAGARDRWDAAKCAPSMFPALQSSGAGDCGEVIARITAAMPQSLGSDATMRAQLARTMEIMRQSCAEDGWPDELKHCVLAAPPGQLPGLQACNDKMPKALQDKMSARLMDAMQKPVP